MGGRRWGAAASARAAVGVRQWASRRAAVGGQQRAGGRRCAPQVEVVAGVGEQEVLAIATLLLRRLLLRRLLHLGGDERLLKLQSRGGRGRGARAGRAKLAATGIPGRAKGGKPWHAACRGAPLAGWPPFLLPAAAPRAQACTPRASPQLARSGTGRRRQSRACSALQRLPPPRNAAGRRRRARLRERVVDEGEVAHGDDRGQPLLVHVARPLKHAAPDEVVGQGGPQPAHLAGGGGGGWRGDGCGSSAGGQAVGRETLAAEAAQQELCAARVLASAPPARSPGGTSGLRLLHGGNACPWTPAAASRVAATPSTPWAHSFILLL